MKNQRATLVLRLFFSVFLMVLGGAGVAGQSSTCVPGAVNNGNGDPWSPDCYLNNACGIQGNPCNANDVVITNVSIDYTCTQGELTSVPVEVTIRNNTGSSRYAVRVYFEFWESGVYDNLFHTGCVAEVIPSGVSVIVVLNIPSIICGQLLEIRNIWIAWDTGSNSNCTNSTTCNDYSSQSKCFENQGGLDLLTSSFTANCQTASEICFTSNVLGGVPPYSIRWYEGDNINPFYVQSSSSNFCYTFPYAGPYDVKLIVSDATGSVITIIQNELCLALPIELTTFTAKETNRTVHLAWSTASEQNNQYFSVERSGPEYAFQEIEKIPGAINSTEPRFYEHVDKAPLAGLNYYRLKQVDTDGAFTYSPAVQVRVGNAGKMNVYPSPAADRLQISLSEPTEEPVTWNVFDVSGRLALTGTQASDVPLFPIELGSIPEGVYVVQVFVGREMFAERFIKK